MNFFTRNLGWILLFAFFIFMLVIISSSNTEENTTQTNLTQSTSTSTGEENLEALAQRLEETSSGEVITSSGETLIGTWKTNTWSIDENNETKEADLNFFERLFWIWNKNNDDTEEPSWTGEIDVSATSSWETLTQSWETSTGQTLTTEPVIPQTVQTIGGKNLVKDTSIDTTDKIKNYENVSSSSTQYYPGTSLTSYVGKEFKVGVEMLKLINASFNETITLMYRGDVLKQLTEENKYGCFKIEIISSKGQKNNGLSWYVCKKYLSDTTAQTITHIKASTTPSSVPKTSETKETNQKELYYGAITHVGNTIEVSYPIVHFDKENFKLAAGDRVDQMSELDKYGCFVGRVYESTIPGSLWKVTTMCLPELRY